MRFTGLVALALLLCPIAFSQTSDSNRSGVLPSVNTAAPVPQVPHPAAQAQQPPSYANYSIMLVGPPGGIAVVLMHNPKNELEFVEVNNTKQALSAGYVPVRAAELGEFISALKDENARLTAENARLQESPSKPAQEAPLPTAADVLAQTRAAQAAEKAARRQQMIQTWMMLQNMNRPQTLNLNVTDCTRSPALCAGR
jgi:hypothetical protein